MKKVLCFILAIAMVFALSVPVFAKEGTTAVTVSVDSSTLAATTADFNLKFEAEGQMKHFTVAKSAITDSDITIKDSNGIPVSGATATLGDVEQDSTYSVISVSVSGLAANTDYELTITKKDFEAQNDKGKTNYYELNSEFSYPFTTASDSSEETTTAAPEKTDPPKIIEGAGQTVEAGEAATFRADIEFDNFNGVLLDGKELDKANYDAKAGSTIVTLHADYVKTLSAGKHTVSILAKDGGMAETTFTVEEETISNTDGPTQAPFYVAVFAITVLCFGAAAVATRKETVK